MKKKVVSLALASVMVLGSVSMAAAAPYDLVHKTNDPVKNYSFLQFMNSNAVFNNVSNDLDNYLLTAKDGKLYSAVEVDAKINQNPGMQFDEAVVGLTPVEIEKPVEGELEVVEVSAITTTFVEVEFAALAEDMEAVTIEVKDGEGNVVEVVAQDLLAGATSAQFDFSTVVAAADLDGVWTVAGVEYSFTELALVQDIVTEATAGNQVALYNLLIEAGIENVDADKIGTYATDIVVANGVSALVWAEDVQAVIDETNEDAVEADEEAAVVKAVADATNQIQLLAALEANFERVNADWIAHYAAENVTVAGPGTVGMLALTATNYFGEAAGADIVGIQAAIDAANTTKIAAADTAASTSAEQAVVTTLIQNWVVADDPATPLLTPKADQIEASNIKKAEFIVAEATTENSLYNALVAYANVTPDATLKASELNANLKSYYKDAFDTKTKAALITEIQSGSADIKGDIVTATDTASLGDALDAVGTTGTALDADQTNATKTTAFKAALQDLADVTSHYTATNAKFLMSTIDDELIVEYATALKAITNADSVAAVQTAVGTVNDATELIVLVKVIEESTDVAETEQALVELANLGHVANFLATPKVDRTFVAEELVAIVDRTTVDTEGEINTAVGNVNTIITTALSAVNGLDNTAIEAATITALENVKVFDDLAAIAKKDVANAFIAEVLEVLEAGENPNFKSYTELSSFIETLM